MGERVGEPSQDSCIEQKVNTLDHDQSHPFEKEIARLKEFIPNTR